MALSTLVVLAVGGAWAGAQVDTGAPGSYHHTFPSTLSLLKSMACKRKAPSPVTVPLNQPVPCST